MQINSGLSYNNLIILRNGFRRSRSETAID
jgi:hypothetical protein